MLFSSLTCNYQPKDNFSDSDRDTISEKLNDLTNKLQEIQLGQEVTYDDWRAELQELKHILNVLGKKHWLQVSKGEIIDAGLGSLSGEAFSILLDAYNEGAPLLNSPQQ